MKDWKKQMHLAVENNLARLLFGEAIGCHHSRLYHKTHH